MMPFDVEGSPHLCLFAALCGITVGKVKLKFSITDSCFLVSLSLNSHILCWYDLIGISRVSFICLFLSRSILSISNLSAASLFSILMARYFLNSKLHRLSYCSLLFCWVLLAIYCDLLFIVAIGFFQALHNALKFFGPGFPFRYDYGRTSGLSWRSWVKQWFYAF